MRVTAVAHDPGGANAVAAVVAALRAGGDHVEAFAKGPAARQFDILGVGCRAVGDDHAAVTAALDAAVLLTGTSAEDTFELDAIEAAAARGIPSIAVIDYWANYRRRFQPRGRSRAPLRLPDLVTALDAHGAQAMIYDGLPADRLRVTGQPYFGWLLRRARTAGPRGAGALRVLFASQPGPDADIALGALAHALQPMGARAALTVRFHPRQTDRSSALARLEQLGARAAIDDEPDTLASLATHDVVFGVTSTILVEAAFLGLPTASILAGGDDPLARVRPGLIAALRTTDAIRRYLGALPVPSPHAVLPVEQRDADVRVAALCRALGAQTRVERKAS